GPNEVLIAIEAAGIGSWDASIRDGSWRKPGRAHFPLVPGVDGAGIVVAAGARVRRIRRGDRVYAYEFGNPQGGFYAEFAVAQAPHVGRVPRRLGTHVIATASGARATRLVRSLGAHRVIDARRTESIEQLRKDAPDGLDALL